MKRFCVIALAALMLLGCFARAEENGELNVYLKSLGERRTIHLTVAGEYAIGGEALCEGTTLALRAENGGVRVSDGAVSVRPEGACAFKGARAAGFTSRNPGKTRATTGA